MADIVLVTRPAGQADRLCERLAQAGFEPLHDPMMIIEPRSELEGVQRQSVLDLDLFQQVIFVSANAVIYGMEWIDRYWPQYPIGLHWYTVGRRSAERLQSYGLDVDSPRERMDSEGLLALPGLQEVEGQRILLVKGEGGRSRIREELCARGARVEELVCYSRRPPQALSPGLHTCLKDGKLTAVMVSSGEGLDNMLSLTDEASRAMLYRIDLLVPGERIAEKARAAGFTSVHSAENATDEAMLEALLQKH